MKILTFSMQLLLLVPLASQPGYSAERKGKAVFETSADEGMRLTEMALKNIEVKTIKLESASEWSVPPESLVRFQDQVGVYRKRQDWFKLANVQIVKKTNQGALIRSMELRAGDELVIHGADLLRVSELDAFGSGE